MSNVVRMKSKNAHTTSKVKKAALSSRPSQQDQKTDSFEDETDFLPMRLRQQELGQVNSNTLSFLPRKRGRPVGSGAGEKRKAEDEYSSNSHTKRARERASNMTASQDELRRVKANYASQKSKVLKKVRSIPGFQMLPLSVQDQKLREAEDALKDRHAKNGYTEQAVRSKLENELIKLNKEIELRDKQSVKAAYRRYGEDLEDDDSVFWSSEDEAIDDFEEVDFGQDDVDKGERYGDIKEGILAGLNDWELRYATPLQLAEAEARERQMTVSAIQKGAWTMFKQDILTRLIKLTRKEHHLFAIGAGRKEWTKLQEGNKSHAERYFAASDKALLRFAFAHKYAENKRKQWIDLPGPPQWWPNVTGRPEDAAKDRAAKRWYMKHGFDVLRDDIQGYLAAAEAISQHEPSKGWIESLAHSDGELIWEPFREGGWKAS